MTTYYNYIGRYGKTHLWKFGETTHLRKREADIRRSSEAKGIKQASNFNFVMSIQTAQSKAQALFIESTVRVMLEQKGYALQGNDHFITNKRKDTVLKDYMEAVSKAIQFVEKF